MPRKKEPTRVRRSFTPDFKRDALRPVAQGKTITEVAPDLWIARSPLQYWERQQDRDSTPSPASGDGVSDAARIRDLEQELRDAREERDILKKALCFADDQR